ncbi:MAG: peptide chain release factor 3 [Acetobacteraceae bacterium]
MAAVPGNGIAPRRTFAIIAHPDAGKTTLTEQLLLAGGAIRLAGEVKARGERRRARSDWMEIEQTRGISVTSSVMTFERTGITFNLLDTPGHQDFSEDTYRTLTAVDSAVMVIDAAKGIESQTRKLFEVCRLRDIPIATFVNKVDREGKDPFALMDEIAATLALDTAPVTWPIGMGTEFRGLFDLAANRLLLAGEDGTAGHARSISVGGPDDPALAAYLPAHARSLLADQAALALGACPPFAPEPYREGHLTPVFFGSALRGFGVGPLLDFLAAHAPGPRPQPAEPRPVSPDEASTTGFVFKVQANMDPQHRDRIAFVRLCSGRFRRGMRLTPTRTGRAMAVQNPIFFFARDRELAEEAHPGDIIGIPNHGTLRVGETLTEGEPIRFTGLPDFAPEILRRVRLADPIRAKQMRKGLEDLAEEGVVQVLRPVIGADWIVGVVGQLQLDVLASRMQSEYGVTIALEPAPAEAARWVAGEPGEVARFVERHRGAIAEDRDRDPVFLAPTRWQLNRAIEEWPRLRFGATKERH